MLYGTKFWVTEPTRQKLHVARMRMLWWMTRQQTYKTISRTMHQRKSKGNTYYKKKLIESPLKWLDHARRRPIEATLRKGDQMEDSPIISGRKRPRKNLRKTIKKDIALNGPSAIKLQQAAMAFAIDRECPKPFEYAGKGREWP